MKDKNIFKNDFVGKFAVIDIDNIDTDMLIPKQFLTTTSRAGLGKYLFYNKRYDKNGEKKYNFVLNQKQFEDIEILVAGKNFGCGSSREHAPWAIKDFGIKVIIAESFADIFYNNCFENLILPISLKKEEIEYIKKVFECNKYIFNENEEKNIIDVFCEGLKGSKNLITINLDKQIVVCGDKSFKFEIDFGKKNKIINQIDTIDEILNDIKMIEEFEKHNEI